MADGVKISEFPEIEELQAGCCFPIISDGENKRIRNDKMMKSLNVYSTNETVVGKWIDGKPIYRKRINNNSITSANNFLRFNLSYDILIVLSCFVAKCFYHNNIPIYTVVTSTAKAINEYQGVKYVITSIGDSNKPTNNDTDYMFIEYVKAEV